MCKKVVNKDTEWIIFLINPLSENISKYSLITKMFQTKVIQLGEKKMVILINLKKKLLRSGVKVII